MGSGRRGTTASGGKETKESWTWEAPRRGKREDEVREPARPRDVPTEEVMTESTDEREEKACARIDESICPTDRPSSECRPGREGKLGGTDEVLVGPRPATGFELAFGFDRPGLPHGHHLLPLSQVPRPAREPLAFGRCGAEAVAEPEREEGLGHPTDAQLSAFGRRRREG